MQMKLGDLIKALEREEKDSPVQYDFCNFVPGKLDSYRGIYTDLALGYSENGQATVGDLLAECRQAVGRVYVGWKGGDYSMDENTTVWVAEPGRSSGTAISEVRGGWPVVLVTEYVD